MNHEYIGFIGDVQWRKEIYVLGYYSHMKEVRILNDRRIISCRIFISD